MMFICVDLDDTLLRNDKSISEFSVKVIKKLQKLNHVFVVNTARNLVRTYKNLDGLIPDYISCNGGSLIIDKNNQIIYCNALTKEETNNIVLELANITTDVNIQTVDALYKTKNRQGYKNEIYYDISNGCHLEALKIIVENIDYVKAKAIEAKYNLTFVNYLGGSWSRFSKKGCSKLTGLQKIVEHAKGSMDDTISFGDDLGDLEMLLGSHIGVAMANSQPCVLDVIDNVTCTNEKDGVAKFLVNYFKLDI